MASSPGASSTPASAHAQLLAALRMRFTAWVLDGLPELSERVHHGLNEAALGAKAARESRETRDALMNFQAGRAAWMSGVAQHLRAATAVPAPRAGAPGKADFDELKLELVGDHAVENRILASRLGLAVMEKAGAAFNDLRVRVQVLEPDGQMSEQDILRPDNVLQALVDGWTDAGLDVDAWKRAQHAISPYMVARLTEGYEACNHWLIEHGVLPKIDFKDRVRRTAGNPGATGAFQLPVVGGVPVSGAQMADGMGAAGWSGAMMMPAGGFPANAGGVVDVTAGAGMTGRSVAGPMVDLNSPLGWVRARAQAVSDQVRRMLFVQAPGGGQPGQAVEHLAPSPGLLTALQAQQLASAQAYGYMPASQFQGGAPTVALTVPHVDILVPVDMPGAARQLRDQTNSLKEKASTPGEKATIEIIALMFQSILAEERIPESIRLLFARLQIPVMRVALSEPEFFGTLEHPARQLIDQMGSCVMGFDAAAVEMDALEAEIRRIVQVIEQYPEVGQRVFAKMVEEFRAFLGEHLVDSGDTKHLVSIAQQVEQKETLAIQYTIEMRNMLKDMPVADVVREYLFKVWSEVLAVAAVRKGAQHEETLMLKRSAADLVWASSAKPSRADRQRVIEMLPHLLQRLRKGMTLLGLVAGVQDTHLKIIGEALSQAFSSKAASVSNERIEELAGQLAALEDVVLEDGAGDLPLDAENIELLVGIDSSKLEVVTDGGSQPSQAMRAWAQELQVGSWFQLDHNGQHSVVQYVWRSARGQLHLFAAPGGRNVLIQARRMAAYLQAGLLSPHEQESLTVRATRTALAKLEANPERLLN